MRRLYNLAIGLFLIALQPAISNAGTIGPPDKVEELRSQSSESYLFIVRGTNDAYDLVSKKARGGASGVTTLPSIGGYAAELHVRDAFALADRPEVEQVWWLHPDFSQIYVNVIRALDRGTQSDGLPTVANISLGPPGNRMPMPYYLDEPMSIATKRAAEAGFIPVIAIGNYGKSDRPDVSLSSPWAYPNWVIAVGAASEDAKTLFNMNGRGSEKDPMSWPDVVAHGIDSIGPWPTNLQKPAWRLEREATNKVFQERVPKDQRHLYTVDSGTSFAAPRVTRSAAQILHFLNGIIAEQGGPRANMKLFALDLPRQNYERSLLVGGGRLTGDVLDTGKDFVEVTYRLDKPWKLVKQLLIDTAILIDGASVRDAGAGFVSPEYIEKQFGRFGTVTIQIEPIKVVE